MKREIFSRPTRFIHKFGETEARDDPMERHTFEFKGPENPNGGGRSAPCEVQTYGETGYRPASSPVQKPGGGFATLDGPALDLAEDFARPVPVGTKRRLGPLKTDK